jgi:hypothetical protein
VRLVSQVPYPVLGIRKSLNSTLTIDFRWLPPTRANLKSLTVPIPLGFSLVSGSG